MNRSIWVLAGVVVAVLGVVVVWIWVPRPQPPGCSFTGWERTLGVTLAAQVKDLEAVQSKVGITDTQVRQFDALARDYALKYDAACQDVSAEPPQMTQEVYSCMRQTMDRMLDEFRRFSQAVEAAKVVPDATAQAKIIQDSLTTLEAARSASYRVGCAATMAVDPKKIAYTRTTPERVINISNRGKRDFSFTIEDYPAGFEPKPQRGDVKLGGSVLVALFRTIIPVPSARPLTFVVRSTSNEAIQIEIEMNDENLAVWSTLGQMTMELAKADSSLSPGHVPTVEDAVRVIEQGLTAGDSVSEADKYLLASNALFQIRADGEARRALDLASKRDPSVALQPSVLTLRGFLANRALDSDAAIQYFAQAKNAVGSTNEAAQATLDLFSGTVLLNRGDKAGFNVAMKNLSGHPELIDATSELRKFSASQLCARGNQTCVTSVLEVAKALGRGVPPI